MIPTCNKLFACLRVFLLHCYKTSMTLSGKTTNSCLNLCSNRYGCITTLGLLPSMGWWWVTIQSEVQRTIYSSRVTGSFQQTSPLLRHLPGILEEGGKKRENNKRTRQSRAGQAASDSALKGICFDFIKLFSWSLQKRNTLCQEREDPTGKATSEW